MKKNKLLRAALIPVTLMGMASCKTSNSSSVASVNSVASEISSISEYSDNKESSSIDNSFLLTNGGNRRLSAEPFFDDATKQIIDALISKGGDLITGGITTYGKTVVINLLKECGIDFRDQTAKTLEKIQEQLTAVQAKITALAEQEDQHHCEDILNPVLTFAKKGALYSSYFVVNGLCDLVNLEYDTSLTEEQVEAERKRYYNETISKLIIDGKPFADFVTQFANTVLTPNQADLSKDIFYYYDETLGVYDTWSSLKIQNTQNFAAYLDSILVSCANLAKFQMYYYTQGMGDISKKSYASMIDTMATSVNAVNEKFKTSLETLKPLEEKKEKGIVTYMKTGKDYSTRMATLTYDINDKVGESDSRQALIRDLYQFSDGRRGTYDRFALQYVPDTDFVAQVAEDFRIYSKAFYTPDYTLIDYLKYAGFYAVNQDLFDKSLGLYNANMYADGYGWYGEDYDYCGTYYDVHGEYKRKVDFKIASYHNWNGNVTRTRLDNVDAGNYYLCFATPDGDRQKLDGVYKTVYMKDVLNTIQKASFFKEIYSDVFDNNKTGWYLHDCW